MVSRLSRLPDLADAAVLGGPADRRTVSGVRPAREWCPWSRVRVLRLSRRRDHHSAESRAHHGRDPRPVGGDGAARRHAERLDDLSRLVDPGNRAEEPEMTLSSKGTTLQTINR